MISFTKNRTRQISYIVIHYVSAKNILVYKNDPYNIEGILELFKEQGAVHKFSCHYLIARDGQIYQMVNVPDTAWQAGKSVIACPEYETNINPSSIGIELVGMENDTFTPEQYLSCADLSLFLEELVVKQALGKIKKYVGHSEVSGELAVRLGIKSRKTMKRDPGTFDWLTFYNEKARLKITEEVKTNCIPELKDRIIKQLSIKELVTIIIQKILRK